VYRLAGALLAGVLLAGLIIGMATAPGSSKRGTRWSEPAILSACSSADSPSIAFPANGPSTSTGPGAIAWATARACPGGAGVRVAALGAADSATTARVLRSRPGAGQAPIALTGTRGGGLLLAAGGALREGLAGGAFGAPQPLAGSAPLALATAYRGQAVALVAPTLAHVGGGLVLRREPFPGSDPGVTRVTTAAGPFGAPAVALDYRTDAIAVWQRGAYLYARSLPRSGLAAPTQRLGRGGANAHAAALISDDARAIVAWTAGDGDRTSVYAEISRPGIRFGRPRLLESYRDPVGAPPPAGSPRLVRLADERVLLAWAGVADGRYVVRVAHVGIGGVAPALTFSPAARREAALLADLAPGPRNDALLLWTQTRAAGVDRRVPQILSAYGILAASGRPLFGAPERVAADAAEGTAQAAFDPHSDRAVAVWRTASGAVAYAVRARGGAPSEAAVASRRRSPLALWQPIPPQSPAARAHRRDLATA
jgi:hypothetical protein